MRIEAIEYANLDSGWTLCETSFRPDVTLLVGLSGAGKTRILSAIQTLRTLATSDTATLPESIRWCLVFVRNDGSRCVWKGETDKSMQDDEYQPPDMITESLSIDGVDVFRKVGDDFLFRGHPTPPLSHRITGLRLFAVDVDLAQISHEFFNLVFLNHGHPSSPLEPSNWYSLTWTKSEFDEYQVLYQSLDSLQRSNLPIDKRIFIAGLFIPEVFHEINLRFRDAFPFVNLIKIDQFRPDKDTFMFNCDVLERNVTRPLDLSQLSAGMLNTFVLLAYCYLWPTGTVILIDEFESSMGTNCLDDVTDLVTETSRRMQFILTSHHPYVINNIRSECWKIVSREGGTVTTRAAAELGIGASRHTAFTQLINSKAYTEGILSE